ncbi:MAG: tRNA lysidine(34) synthetase TilS [Pseudomonadota bacterium]
MPERLPKYVSEAFLPHPPKAMGVAVSGGSDSMALLHLLRDFCMAQKVQLHAVTVNHSLRDEAAGEAETVAQHCAQLKVPHDTLVWEGWNGHGNLQEAARDARYKSMAEWAHDHQIDTIAMGHTADDQAETMLMRLARRSGVDGLSGMNMRSLREGINWVRPLLRSRRAILRSYLTERGISWIDDPSNEDARFDRVRIRKALEILEPLGVDADVLSEVANHMLEARKALDWQTFLASKHIATIEAGAVVLDETILRLQPDEIQRRLMVKAISWVGSAVQPPRMQAVANLMEALRNGQAGTVCGCHVRRIAARIWIFRELNAVQDLTAATHMFWDRKWEMVPLAPAEHAPDLRVRSLGMDGLEQCPDWRDTGLPHVVLLSTPSIWRGDELIAAPHAGVHRNWQMNIAGGADAFFAALLAH